MESHKLELGLDRGRQGKAQTSLHVVSATHLHGQPTRVGTDGKYLRAGGEAFRVRGVTYGSFLPRLDGEPFPDHRQVEHDFAAMSELGLNVVRTYAAPPPDVLESAQDHGLRILVGLHYDDWRMETQPGRAANRRVRAAALASAEEAMQRCAGNESVLGISIGNEVPGDVIRVHGIGEVEAILSEVTEAVHRADPDMLVTYSNYPTTEYLRIEGLDLVSFNVFLERPEKLLPYLRHLQIVAGDRPLLVSELGLASVVHGLEAQAESLDWQLRLVDEAGCAGATVFSWTDEWGVGGDAVEGWGFGITTDDRSPKPATEVVREWAARDIIDLRRDWPSLSVVVCAYNEARLIEECLDSLMACEYPGLEVIVCDDGSTDRTLELARRYPFRVLELDHGGLSRARNAGIEASNGEIVAFLDADAACHPLWPFHLALAMEQPRVVACGGPNLPFDDAPFAERAVAYSPGGPIHVLISDDRAEHVPGCNMAFRKSALCTIGGFDASFTSAGDDVDVCWKLLDSGGEIAFSAAAQVRHHRRDSLRAYLRQQRNYGRSERMVASRHRHRFNRLGQARWSGFIYDGRRLLPSLLRPVVYHGYQGHAPFQGVAEHRSERAMGWVAAMLPLVVPLFVLGLLAAPMTVAGMWVAGGAATALVLYALAVFTAFRPSRDEPDPLRMRATVTLLHVAQPIVRAWGRLRAKPLPPGEPPPPPVWTGDRGEWLPVLAEDLSRRGLHVRIGGPHDTWDLRVSVGPFMSALITTAIVWRWTPLHRGRFRPRPLLIAAATASGAAALAGGPGLVVGPLILLAVLVEVAIVRRALRMTLAATTEAAR